jgi:hypothetical protein
MKRGMMVPDRKLHAADKGVAAEVSVAAAEAADRVFAAVGHQRTQAEGQRVGLGNPVYTTLDQRNRQQEAIGNAKLTLDHRRAFLAAVIARQRRPIP